MYKKLIRDNKVKYMVGEFNQEGRLCTRIYIEGNDFLIDKTPLEIIDHTLNEIGYDYRGAVAGSKSLLGNCYMPPVMVCPFNSICFFPHKSVYHADCIWFNFSQVRRPYRLGNKTRVDFFDGTFIILDSKVISFSIKYMAAEQLIKITKRRG